MAYFANGTEGETLDRQCRTCPMGERRCPVLLVQLAHNYDQVGNKLLRGAMNMLVDEAGQCQLRPLLVSIQDEARRARRASSRRPSGGYGHDDD